MRTKVIIDSIRRERRLYDNKIQRDEYVISVLKSKTNTINEINTYEYSQMGKMIYGVHIIDNYHYEN